MKLVLVSAIAAAVAIGLVHAVEGEHYYTVLREVCCKQDQEIPLFPFKEGRNVGEKLKHAIEEMNPTPSDCQEKLSLRKNDPKHGLLKDVFSNTHEASTPLDPETEMCLGVRMIVKLPHELKREPSLKYLTPSDFKQFSEVDEVDLAISSSVKNEDVSPLRTTRSGRFKRGDAEELSDQLLSNSSVDEYGGRQADDKPDKFRRAMQFMFITAWADDNETYSQNMEDAKEQAETRGSSKNRRTSRSRKP